MNILLCFAGGVGKRMHAGDLPKQFMEYQGKPILVYTLEKFEQHPLVDGIVLVCVADYIEYAKDLLQKFDIKKVVRIVAGGKTGQESIYKGLLEIKDIGQADDVILIHDGVRPFVTEETITGAINCTKLEGNAVAVVPSIETVIVCNGNQIEDIMDRSRCQMAKAPQCFRLGDILAVHEKALSEGRDDFIDSASMMMHYGYTLHVVETTYDNIKITTPKDFCTFCALVDMQSKGGKL